MEQEKTEVLKGTLDMLVLKVVALGPIHGYAISQRIQRISKDFLQVPEGSLYPALHRMEDRGWLQAKWEDTESGREAKRRSVHAHEPMRDRVKRAAEHTPRAGWDRGQGASALQHLPRCPPRERQ